MTITAETAGDTHAVAILDRGCGSLEKNKKSHIYVDILRGMKADTELINWEIMLAE